MLIHGSKYIDFLIFATGMYAGMISIFQKISKEHGQIVVLDSAVLRNDHMNRIGDLFLLGQLGKIEEYRVDDRIGAEGGQRIIGDALLILVQIILQCFVILLFHVFLQDGNMVAYIMADPSGIGNLVLELLVLNGLEGKLMVIFLEHQVLILFEDQLSHHIIDQTGTDIHEERKNRIPGG